MKTIGQIIKVVQTLVPATRTINNGDSSSEAVVDTKGFNNVCFVVLAGDGTFVDETYSFQVRESDNSDGSSSSAVTGAVAAVTADNQVKKIQVSGLGTGSRKRYMFVRASFAGSNESLPCAAFAILAGGAGLNPVQDPDASV